jgi:AcrR family transcriptional regulator
MATARPDAGTPPKKRLTTRDWIDCALDIMVEQSIEQVRVEPLAEKLGVTKGSFYWHFKDRDALLSAILAHWADRSTLAIIRRVDGGSEDPAERIWQLMMVPFASERSSRGAEIELAIRAWARRSELARAAIDQVDRQRLGYLGKLFEQAGFSGEDAAQRAFAAYAALHASSYIRPDPDSLRREAARLVHRLLLRPD